MMMVQALNPSPIYYFKCTEGIYVKLSKGKMKKREKEWSVKRELNVKVREIVKPRMSVKPIKNGEELKRTRQKKKIFKFPVTERRC